jgi:uncharacterized protein (TIGR03086 family)
MDTNHDTTPDRSSTSAVATAGIDPRPLFSSAAQTATAVMSWVTLDQLDRPTPCRAFDVAQLLDHLALVGPRIAALGRGHADYSTNTGGTEGWRPADITNLFSGAVADAETAWADPESLERMLTLPWATLPGAAVLTMYVSELTVHTWDLAKATGQQPEWDPSVLETSLAFMHEHLSADIRGDASDAAVPFAPVVLVTSGASLIDQLVAWTGRDPAWS